MKKSNCWEIKKCGRQPGGVNTAKQGVCTASTETKVDGINDGKNGGRCCWVISGTLCGGVVQGTFASKVQNCLKCEFYCQVQEEEGDNFVRSAEILKKLK